MATVQSAPAPAVQQPGTISVPKDIKATYLVSLNPAQLNRLIIYLLTTCSDTSR
jgi:hypothetical protein